MSPTRMEHDSLGVIAVPGNRLWGAQTQRAIRHFAISSERMPEELIHALASVKHACAQVNLDLGLLDSHKAHAIMAACDEIAAGQHALEFPLSIWQSGSGTQTNMNLNEVIAHRATVLLGRRRQAGLSVHPNDDVNLGQSTNDVFPTAMHLAAHSTLTDRLLPAMERLLSSFNTLALEHRALVKIGRTHLQDATPLTLGQAFSGHAAQLDHALAGVRAARIHLLPLAIGGTAVGTGLNTHPEFGERVAAELARLSGHAFTSAPNKFFTSSCHDGWVSVHGSLRTLAVGLHKIANDIRWLASGPRSGLGEINLPENEPGSSMMPGKINPTQCEALSMVCLQVMANDGVIGMAGAAGSFELNTCKPLLAHAMLQSLRLLGDAMARFDEHCVRGISANPLRIAELVERSLMLVTALVPHVGYDRAAKVALKAHYDGTSLREAALALHVVTAEEFVRWVRPAEMVHAGPSHGKAKDSRATIKQKSAKIASVKKDASDESEI